MSGEADKQNRDQAGNWWTSRDSGHHHHPGGISFVNWQGPWAEEACEWMACGEKEDGVGSKRAGRRSIIQAGRSDQTGQADY